MRNLRAIITPRSLILAPVQNQFFWNNKRSLFSKIQMHNITLQIRSTNSQPKEPILNSNSNNRIPVSISWELVPELETSPKAMSRANKTNSKAHRTTDKPREVLLEEANPNHQLVSLTKIWMKSRSTIKMGNSRTRVQCSNLRAKINWPRTEDLSWLSNSTVSYTHLTLPTKRIV